MTRCLPAVALLLAGCGDSATTPPPADTGADTSADVAGDTGTDTGAPDVPTQADVPAASDAGADVPADATVDVAHADAGADAAHADAAHADAAADAPADPWACLGHVTAPTATPGMGTLNLAAQNFQSGAAMVGLTVKACAHDDLTCATPLSMGTTDATGHASLTFALTATGFNGYFEFTGGTGANEVVPTRSFVVLTSTTVMTNFALVPRSTFALLGAALGATLDATHGAVTFAAADCNGARAAGVSVAAAPATMGMQFYFAGGLPNPAATQTDASGLGGAVNVAPGDYTFTGTRVSGMARIGASAVSVRGGYTTSFNVYPTP